MSSELGHTQPPALADGGGTGAPGTTSNRDPRPSKVRLNLLPQGIHLERTGLPCKA